MDMGEQDRDMEGLEQGHRGTGTRVCVDRDCDRGNGTRTLGTRAQMWGTRAVTWRHWDKDRGDQDQDGGDQDQDTETRTAVQRDWDRDTGSMTWGTRTRIQRTKAGTWRAGTGMRG